MTTQTLAQKLARYFQERPGQWIDGRYLSAVAGCYAWRSRVSDLRKPPFVMTIENRQQRHTIGGIRWVVSEYRYHPQNGAVS